MGNYHDVLMKRQSLRPIEDDDRKKRGVFFGNPFVRSDKVLYPHLSVSLPSMEDDLQLYTLGKQDGQHD